MLIKVIGTRKKACEQRVSLELADIETTLSVANSQYLSCLDDVSVEMVVTYLNNRHLLNIIYSGLSSF